MQRVLQVVVINYRNAHAGVHNYIQYVQYQNFGANLLLDKTLKLYS